MKKLNIVPNKAAIMDFSPHKSISAIPVFAFQPFSCLKLAQIGTEFCPKPTLVATSHEKPTKTRYAGIIVPYANLSNLEYWKEQKIGHLKRGVVLVIAPTGPSCSPSRCDHGLRSEIVQVSLFRGLLLLHRSFPRALS